MTPQPMGCLTRLLARIAEAPLTIDGSSTMTVDAIATACRQLREGAGWAGDLPADRRGGIESSGRLGRYRYVVERSLAWLVGCRRLRVRYERRADILLGSSAWPALICLKQLNRLKG